MKLKNYVILLSLFIYYQPICLQSQPINLVPHYHQYVLNKIDLHGYSKANQTSVVFLLNSNPALFSKYKKACIGLSYQIESDIEKISYIDVNHKRSKWYIPQSVLLIFPVKEVSAGLGFTQQVNSFMEFPTLESMTLEHPEGTGEFIKNTRETYIFKYAAIASIQRIISEDFKLNPGIQVNLYHLYQKVNISNDKFSLESYDFGWKVGVSSSIFSYIDFGISFTKGTIIKTSNRWKGFACIPDKLDIGISSSPMRNVELSAELTNEYWKAMDSELDNAFCHSYNLNYTYKKRLRVTLGYLFDESFYPQNDNDILNIDYYNNLKADYIIAGANINFNDYSVGLLVADNHRSAGNWREQTICKLLIARKL